MRKHNLSGTNRNKFKMKTKETVKVLNPIYEYFLSYMAFKAWMKYSSLSVKLEGGSKSPRRKRVSFQEESGFEGKT